MPPLKHSLFLLLIACSACGDPEDRVPVAGPLTELPLLPPINPDAPYNHANEASIAAYGDHVVIAYVNRHLLSATGYDFDTFARSYRRVAVAVSHDRGATFRVSDPPGPIFDVTSDPVVRVAADGTFWLVRLQFDIATTGSLPTCQLARSTDFGETWATLVTDIDCEDKPWLAIDDAGKAVYLTSLVGIFKYSQEGAPLGSVRTLDSSQGYAGYADAAGAHFAVSPRDQSLEYQIIRFDGTTLAYDGQPLPGGPFASAPEYDQRSCLGLGRTSDGGQWIVRSLADRTVSLRVRRLPNDEGRDLVFSAPGATAFYATGSLDGQARLHTIWYDSTGPVGVIRYAHTLSSALTSFTPAITVDAEACPGSGFYPRSIPAQELNRLREYIDVAVAGRRAYMAWTRAVQPPSRVYTTYVDF
ncbi:MAG TPA: sialidase family protein [Polyangia bacterium]|jgi:hypothetical protein|nr:sialidase family protein [Polyangia bacterium]